MSTFLASRNIPAITIEGANLGGQFSISVEPILNNLGSVNVTQSSDINLSLANAASTKEFRLVSVIPLDYRPNLKTTVGLARFSIDSINSVRYFISVQPEGHIDFETTIIDYTGSGMTNWFGNPGATNVRLIGDINFICGRIN